MEVLVTDPRFIAFVERQFAEYVTEANLRLKRVTHDELSEKRQRLLEYHNDGKQILALVEPGLEAASRALYANGMNLGYDADDLTLLVVNSRLCVVPYWMTRYRDAKVTIDTYLAATHRVLV